MIEVVQQAELDDQTTGSIGNLDDQRGLQGVVGLWRGVGVEVYQHGDYL